MSYIVTIRRNADLPITQDEIKGIVAGDQNLTCSVAPSGSGSSPVLLALALVGALLWAYWHFVG